jgi:hypothetical protein
MITGMVADLPCGCVGKLDDFYQETTYTIRFSDCGGVLSIVYLYMLYRCSSLL